MRRKILAFSAVAMTLLPWSHAVNVTDSGTDVTGSVNLLKASALKFDDGLLLSYELKEKISSPGAVQIYLDTDMDAGSGMPFHSIGADYLVRDGGLQCFTDGKWTEKEAIESAESAMGRRFFIKHKQLNLTGKESVALFFEGINSDGGGNDLVPEVLNGALVVVSSNDAMNFRNVYANVSNATLSLTDPANDSPLNGVVDFVGGSVRIRDGILGIHYTANRKIKPAELKYQVKVLIATAPHGGYDNKGANYLVEEGKIFRFAGEKPFQWKWEKIQDVKMRFQDRYCEIDVPMAAIAESPCRLSFRFQCMGDYMPDLNQDAAVLVHGNAAADAVVTTSPDRTDYWPRALHDGQISGQIYYADSSWASREDGGDKFIRFDFSKPTEPKRLVIYWEKPAAELEIQTLENDCHWRTVGKITPGTNDSRSIIDLEGIPVAVKTLRLLQKEGAGIQDRPQLLWVREVEIFE